MKKQILALIVIIFSLSARPLNWKLKSSSQGEIQSEQKIKGNYISDIHQYDNDEIVLVTGNGLSFGNLNEVENNSSWSNTMTGKGGVSAYDFTDINGKRIDFLSTGEYSYYDDIGDFATVNNGLHFSYDKGLTWNYIKPPIHWKRDSQGNYVKAGTPIEGICYNMDIDNTGHLWLACFGQSLQRISLQNIEEWQTDQKQSNTLNTDTLWQTVWPNDLAWAPGDNKDQIMFAVHVTDNGYVFAGSAGGAHLLLNPDAENIEDFKWLNFNKKQIYGNWITVIDSQQKDDGTELVWLAVWPVNDSEIQSNNDEIYTVVNLERKDDSNWRVKKITDLDGIKAYNFAFRGDEVFIATDQGLFYANHPDSRFEKYNLVVNGKNNLSGQVKTYETIYSVYADNNYLLVGTSDGLLISDDNGFSFKATEAGDEAKKTYAYPNPFSPYKYDFLKIRFNAQKESYVKVEIYNFAMEKARTITSPVKYSKGDHYITWDGRDDYGDIVANGAYFYKLKAGGKTYWNKILVFK